MKRIVMVAACLGAAVLLSSTVSHAQTTPGSSGTTAQQPSGGQKAKHGHGKKQQSQSGTPAPQTPSK